MSLTSLDTIAKEVSKQMRAEDEESFIPTKTNKPATHNNLRLDLLKHVIATKVQENEEKKARTERLAKLATLKELAANKANEQFMAKSLDEIQKEIAELEMAGIN